MLFSLKDAAHSLHVEGNTAIFPDSGGSVALDLQCAIYGKDGRGDCLPAAVRDNVHHHGNAVTACKLLMPSIARVTGLHEASLELHICKAQAASKEDSWQPLSNLV